MRKILMLAFGLFVTGVTVAAGQDVRYDFDKDKNFGQYKTYKWVPIKGADQPDELTARQVTAAIDTELATKGLSRTDSETADLLVGFQTAISTEKEYTSYNSGWNYGPGWGGAWYGGGGMSTTYGSTSTVYVGQLDLSMYDPVQKQLVWRGLPPRPWIQRPSQKRNRRTLRRQSRSYSRIFRHNLRNRRQSSWAGHLPIGAFGAF